MTEIESMLQQLADKYQTILDHVEIQNSLRHQLHDAIKREVMLRDALGELVALKNLKDRAESAEDSSTNAYCGNEYATRKPAAWKSAKEALAATADLDSLILCHAEPVRYIYEFKDYEGRTIWSSNLEHNGQVPTATIPLYRAWEPK